MKSKITNTLIITMMLLNLADSRIPINNKIDMAATINIAGRFRNPSRCGRLLMDMPDSAKFLANSGVKGFQPICGISTKIVPNAAVNCAGIRIPKSFRKLTT